MCLSMMRRIKGGLPDVQNILNGEKQMDFIAINIGTGKNIKNKSRTFKIGE